MQVEVGIYPQEYSLRCDAGNALKLFLRYLGYGLSAVVKVDHSRRHGYPRVLAVAAYGDNARMAVESGKSRTVAILHVGYVERDGGRTFRALHALADGVGGGIEIVYHPARLQAQPSLALGERPGVVHGIVVPLPVQAQLVAVEAVARHQRHLAHTVVLHLSGHGGHHHGHFAVAVAQHGPSVNPTAGRQCEHTAHTATVLEDYTVPVAVGTVDDGALPHVGESGEVVFQYLFLLVRAGNVVGTVAQLTALAATRPRYHQQIVLAVVLYHAAALQQSVVLVVVAHHSGIQAARFQSGEVLVELLQATRAAEHVDTVVIIEEERRIVKMLQPRVQRPSLRRVGRLVYICVAAGIVVGREQGIEHTIVILQRCSPLSAAVHRSLVHVVLGRVGETVEQIAHRLPVGQVGGTHHRGARHQVHRGSHHIVIVTHTNHIGVGHVGPQHRIGHHGCI